MQKKSEFTVLKKGDFLSEIQYYKVVDIVGGTVQVENERGFKFAVSSGIVEEGMFSANQFTEEVSLTRTELIEQLGKVGNTIFTVNFNKLPTADTINEAIESLNNGKILPIKEMKKKVKEAFKGEERTLIGYLVNTETGFGRSTVIDMEQSRGDNPEWDARLRQVDHRTINWLIHKNTKYIIKKK